MQEGSELIFETIDEISELIHNQPEYFDQLLIDLKEILLAKGQDYSGTEHQWFNFEFAGNIVDLPIEHVITTICAIKFSRLHSLAANSNRKPNFESFEDNIKDLINYLILLTGYLKFKKSQENVTVL